MTKVTIVNKNNSATKAMEEKVNALLPKIYKVIDESKVQEVKVVAKRRKRSKLLKVETLIFTDIGIFRKEEQGMDFYDMLPELFKQLAIQIKKYIDRKKDISIERRRERKAEINGSNKTVKELSLEVISAEEAEDQMNNLNHDFYIFINEEDNLIYNIYRKKDGGTGLIKVV